MNDRGSVVRTPGNVTNLNSSLYTFVTISTLTVAKVKSNTTIGTDSSAGAHQLPG